MCEVQKMPRKLKCSNLVLSNKHNKQQPRPNALVC